MSFDAKAAERGLNQTTGLAVFMGGGRWESGNLDSMALEMTACKCIHAQLKEWAVHPRR